MRPYQELRFYCFTNFYLSSIQHGIQTGHASVRLIRKYQKELQAALSDEAEDKYVQARISKGKDDLEIVEDWADNHETYITLNGGDDTALKNAYELVSKTQFPFVEFIEPGIGNVRTAVGVVLPDTIFNMKREIFHTELEPAGFPVYKHEPSGWMIFPNDSLYPFMEYFKSCGLAR